ncbi:hypothetical protein B0H11DRAFT_1988832 [Mycena galericulata]|nr:hypothetical protein B0H11DRAFT_2002124 [Mycena galericulata]KAJ7498329.1 hypothetical protein B0H11DRAFT_1997453 [Mycena galericulata]KAJ7502341.1 hypothetical protein B0H11DRAFT_1990109 [Mycena galericulata]KAJ7502510.1 hypothetical protein B0H11DRAFT_1988832 [Mycena galericulata]
MSTVSWGPKCVLRLSLTLAFVLTGPHCIVGNEREPGMSDLLDLPASLTVIHLANLKFIIGYVSLSSWWLPIRPVNPHCVPWLRASVRKTV